MFFRNWLKNFIPMSSRSLNGRLDNLQNNILNTQFDVQKIPNDLEVLKRDNLNLQNALDELRNQVNKNTNDVKKQLNTVKTAIPNQPVFWNSAFERTMLQNNWGFFWQELDFSEKYLSLISNLDAESIRIINDILIRVETIISDNSMPKNLFEREEQEHLRIVQEKLKNKILRISDNLYAYKNYLLPINHFEASVFYYKHGLSVLTHPERIKGKSILDIGGFIGDSILVLNEMDPSEIYTFEADPSNYELLLKTIELNHIQNVTPENLALGAFQTNMVLHTRGSMGTLIDRPGVEYEDIEVPVIPLDIYVQDHPMTIGLIKVDIEGGEPGFLEGAKQTICEQKPTLLISIYHNVHDFFELKPLLESWNLGYNFKIHKPTIGNTSSETLLIAETD